LRTSYIIITAGSEPRPSCVKGHEEDRQRAVIWPAKPRVPTGVPGTERQLHQHASTMRIPDAERRHSGVAIELLGFSSALFGARIQNIAKDSGCML